MHSLFRSDASDLSTWQCMSVHGLLSAILLLTSLPTEINAGNDPSTTTRSLWTTSRVEGSPSPPDPFVLENAFPQARFDSPLAMTLIPDSNRFLVAERHGKIFTLENKPDAQKTLLTDLQRTVYGLAAHPQFEQNGYLFIASIVKDGDPMGSRLSRFHVQRDNGTLTLEQDSELVLLEWLAGGHNGGCVRFGPDGYLYLSTGDGSAWSDWNITGQRIDDLLASILRIDVDHQSDDKPYSIPADNPFVDHEDARPEIYSYGHRNVWKFSFDRDGRLWAGDVGQDLWEYIELVEKGGNYGWSINEGSHPFFPDREQGPTPILSPIVEHPHSESRSITGGYVSWSADQPELNGHYIYGDYDTGKIWSLRLDGDQVTDQRQLADTQLRVVSFGQDENGRVLVIDFVSGTIRKLVPAPPVTEDTPEFPRKLSETGLFASTKDHTPAPGVIPYSVNAPLWSDGAIKDRLLAIPGDGKIEFDAVSYPMPAPGWRFPDGTVAVKTFSMQMDADDPSSVRRLETRILHHRRMPGDDDEYGNQVWNGYTYVWNDEQTDAVLLDAQGLDRELTIRDSRAPNGIRKQTWRFPSQAECTLCHTMSAKYVLGINTMQMNRDHDYDGVQVNQLEMLQRLGLFTEKLPDAPKNLARLPHYDDTDTNIEQRARAYLHANCSHCHRIWGGGNSDFQIQADISLASTSTVNVAPTRGHYELEDPALILPGHPERSLIWHRMTLLKTGRMPHVGSNVVDPQGVSLVKEWISQLKDDPDQ